MKALDGLRRASFEIRYAIVSKLLDWSDRVMKHREAAAFPPLDVAFFHGDADPEIPIVVSKPKFHHWRRYLGASIDGPYARPCLTEIEPGETKRCECGAMTLYRRSESGSGAEWREDA